MSTDTNDKTNPKKNPPSAEEPEKLAEEDPSVCSENDEELAFQTGDPEEAGKRETISRAPDTLEIDKLIGRKLKLPPVQDDGQW